MLTKTKLPTTESPEEFESRQPEASSVTAPSTHLAQNADQVIIIDNTNTGASNAGASNAPGASNTVASNSVASNAVASSAVANGDTQLSFHQPHSANDVDPANMPTNPHAAINAPITQQDLDNLHLQDNPSSQLEPQHETTQHDTKTSTPMTRTQQVKYFTSWP